MNDTHDQRKLLGKTSATIEVVVDGHEELFQFRCFHNDDIPRRTQELYAILNKAECNLPLETIILILQYDIEVHCALIFYGNGNVPGDPQEQPSNVQLISNIITGRIVLCHVDGIGNSANDLAYMSAKTRWFSLTVADELDVMRPLALLMSYRLSSSTFQLVYDDGDHCCLISLSEYISTMNFKCHCMYIL